MSEQGRGRARLPLALSCICAAVLPCVSRAAAAQTLSPFGARSASGWRVTAGVGEQWESNVLFTSADPTADYTTRARVEGARLWRTTRTRVELLASGSIVRFAELTEFDRTSYDFTLVGSRQLSRRATGSFDLRAQSDLTTRSITPVGEGPLLRGLTAARTQSGSGTLAYRLSRAMSTRFGVHYQQVSFDDVLLAGGWIAGATASLGRIQSRSTSYSLDYGFQRTVVGPTTDDAHQFTAGLSHQLGDRLSASASAGASLQDRTNSRVGTVNFVGSGALAMRFARQSLLGQYQHYVGREFGRVVPVLTQTDLVALGYQRNFTQHISLDLGARHAWSQVPDAFGGPARSAEGTGGLRYTPRSGIAVGMGAFYRRREDRVSAIEDRGLSLGLGYAWSGLRSMPASPTPGAP